MDDSWKRLLDDIARSEMSDQSKHEMFVKIYDALLNNNTEKLSEFQDEYVSKATGITAAHAGKQNVSILYFPKMLKLVFDIKSSDISLYNKYVLLKRIYSIGFWTSVRIGESLSNINDTLNKILQTPNHRKGPSIASENEIVTSIQQRINNDTNKLYNLDDKIKKIKVKIASMKNPEEITRQTLVLNKAQRDADAYKKAISELTQTLDNLYPGHVVGNIIPLGSSTDTTQPAMTREQLKKHAQELQERQKQRKEAVGQRHDSAAMASIPLAELAINDPTATIPTQSQLGWSTTEPPTEPSSSQPLLHRQDMPPMFGPFQQHSLSMPSGQASMMGLEERRQREYSGEYQRIDPHPQFTKRPESQYVQPAPSLKQKIKKRQTQLRHKSLKELRESVINETESAAAEDREPVFTPEQLTEINRKEPMIRRKEIKDSIKREIQLAKIEKRNPVFTPEQLTELNRPRKRPKRSAGTQIGSGKRVRLGDVQAHGSTQRMPRIPLNIRLPPRSTIRMTRPEDVPMPQRSQSAGSRSRNTASPQSIGSIRSKSPLITGSLQEIRANVPSITWINQVDVSNNLNELKNIMRMYYNNEKIRDIVVRIAGCPTDTPGPNHILRELLRSKSLDVKDLIIKRLDKDKQIDATMEHFMVEFIISGVLTNMNHVSIGLDTMLAGFYCEDDMFMIFPRYNMSLGEFLVQPAVKQQKHMHDWIMFQILANLWMLQKDYKFVHNMLSTETLKMFLPRTEAEILKEIEMIQIQNGEPWKSNVVWQNKWNGVDLYSITTAYYRVNNRVYRFVIPKFTTPDGVERLTFIKFTDCAFAQMNFKKTDESEFTIPRSKYGSFDAKTDIDGLRSSVKRSRSIPLLLDTIMPIVYRDGDVFEEVFKEYETTDTIDGFMELKK